MAATGVLGARLYTSATPLADVEAGADAIGDFQALTITTEVGLVESFTEVGKVYDVVPFVPISSGRTHKLKGPYNSGQFTVTVAQDLTDAGQAALLSYVVGDQNTDPFKLTYVGADANYDTHYFGAKVMSFRTILGAANSVMRATIVLEINTDPFIGAS